MEAGKLGFDIVIGRSDNGFDRRQTFITMRCERSGTYQPSIRKLEHDTPGQENVSVCLNCTDTERQMIH